MSSTTETTTTETELDVITNLYRNYYWDELGELLESYPQERKTMRIDHHDIYKRDMGFADDLLTFPEEKLRVMDDALTEVETPVDVELGNAKARVYNLSDEHIYGVSDYALTTVAGTLELRGISQEWQKSSPNW